MGKYRNCLNEFCRTHTDTECQDCHGCEYCCTCDDPLAYFNLPECDLFGCTSIIDCFECEGCFDHCICEDNL